MGEQKPYSYHIFSFPFRWDYKADSKPLENIDYEHRTDLEKFTDALTNHKDALKNSLWKRKQFKPDIAENYNQSSYFYGFAADAMFDEADGKPIKDKILVSFQYEIKENTKYKISIYSKNFYGTYDLDIKKITLNSYNTGVAVLSFHLENKKYLEYNQILRINEFGRRIFPAFLGENFDKDDVRKCLDAPRKKILAEKIELQIGDKTIGGEITYDEKVHFQLPIFIQDLLPPNFKTKIENNNENVFYIRWLLDDRMFVTCWYGNDEFSNLLKENYEYKKSEEWYKYVFIDTNSVMCQHDQMMMELIELHTYRRFINWRTFYGVSRYSFVCLTSSLDTLKQNDADFIPIHLRNLYFQMVQLSLVQRASLLRFAEEVSFISTLKNNDKNTPQKIKDLNREYLQFVNKMYFREVTAQEQGIELYDMIQDKMRIDRDIKDLNHEIDELYQYANLLEEAKENRTMRNISIGGAILLLPSLIAAIFGMNTLNFENNENIGCISLQLTIALPLLLISVFGIYLFKHKIIKAFLSVVLFYILIVYFLKNIYPLL